MDEASTMATADAAASSGGGRWYTGMSADNIKGLVLAVSSNLFISASFVIKKKGLKKAASSSGVRAGNSPFSFCSCARRQRRRDDGKGAIKRPEEFVREFRNKEIKFLPMRTRLKAGRLRASEDLNDAQLLFAIRILGQSRTSTVPSSSSPSASPERIRYRFRSPDLLRRAMPLLGRSSGGSTSSQPLPQRPPSLLACAFAKIYQVFSALQRSSLVEKLREKPQERMSILSDPML